jgi:tRNA-modifying protein YgfZ
LSNSTSEYRQVHERAGLIDVSQRGKIELVGPDAAGFLHNLSTNDIRSLAPGAGCEIFLTNAKAKVVAHGWVYHLPSESQTFWLDVDPAGSENAVEHLNKYLISEQVEMADRTNDFAQLYLVGPKSREVLEKSTGQKLAEWRELQCGFIQWSDSLSVQVRFHRRFALDCFEIVCPRAQSDEISKRLTAVGVEIVSS